MKDRLALADAEEIWIERPVEQQVRDTIASHQELFLLIVTDILTMPDDVPILAVGAALMPSSVRHGTTSLSTTAAERRLSLPGPADTLDNRGTPYATTSVWHRLMPRRDAPHDCPATKRSIDTRKESRMTDVTQRGAIHFLSDTDLTVADPAEDVRGRDVVDSTGEKIGTVDDLALDDRENRVRFLRVAHGGFLGIGEDHFLVPVDAITRIDDDQVHVNRQRKDLGDVPGYRPDLAEKPDYYEGVYGWWGYGPYWAPGYAYPGYPGYVI